MSDRLMPTHIEQVGTMLALRWNDGTESILPLEVLRRGCPCAVCGGEPDVLGNLQRPDVTYTEASFELKAWQIVGGYAVQPGWADGHGTGLYTFPLLKRLADGPAAVAQP